MTRQALHANQRHVAAVTTGVIKGLLTARRITDPLHRLNVSAGKKPKMISIIRSVAH
jgi:hypothetical protein